ncbi:beta-ketoacyl synthase N-terminal-like domain-containing protein [Propionibacterium acidifaciens]|uniref:beta-ketoacyl synthase N-terminal-like domain-containing protein n=1 Tax=Propionibacterium acidifaciens TaxID=556499 RepID=UPI001F30F60C|nr:beta-ketoacyl synthase N-terminal-like domain-containing protein [Propionibacterium acidifaciens]
MLAEIGGYGTSCDGYHQTAPDPRGEGAFQSMADALACAGCEPADVSYVNLHGTGTPTNDAVEPKAISRLFGETAPVTSSTKSALGHTLGAAGAVEAVCAVLAIRTGTIPPTINTRGITSPSGLDIVPDQARSGPVDVVLSNSFAFGGNNASLVVTGPRGKPSPASGAHRSDVMITGIAGVCGKAATTEELIAAFADGGEFEELENLPGGIGGAVPFARSDLTRLRRGVNPARARRMDPLSLLANAALTDMYSRYGRPTRAESAGTGIVFATGYGPLSALLSFHEGVVKEGMRGADPLVFPNTVVNAATGHLAMLHRLRGYTATLAGAGVSSIMALTLARHVIARGGAERIVVVVADEFPDLAISSAVLRGGFRRVGEQCGAVLADGAVAIMLESRRSARERDAAPLARIMSSAATGTAEEPCGEDSAERSWADCLSTALQRAGADSEDIATFVSARCGDPAHDALEKKAARRVGLSGTRTLAPQMLIGNSAGSAAGLGLLNALVDEERRKDDLIMLSSCSDGGAFASMVVECA